eukprot:Pompholyxophrys_sp_v1_NODE_46_length_3087_cov_706.350264.p1 type:complete len:106 gc:universal NODE_46_length_3087_cov_706.350264:2539-2856(+)
MYYRVQGTLSLRREGLIVLYIPTYGRVAMYIAMWVSILIIPLYGSMLISIVGRSIGEAMSVKIAIHSGMLLTVLSLVASMDILLTGNTIVSDLGTWIELGNISIR